MSFKSKYLVSFYLKIIIHVKNFFFFYYPNFFFFTRKKIEIKNKVQFIQKTLITGKGTVEIKKGCSFGFKLGGFYHKGNIEIQPRYENSFIIFGENVSTNNNIFFCAANYIEIGDDCLIGQNVTIMDHEAHGRHPDKRRKIGKIGQIKIGNNVWIGNNVVILKNSEIGDNSIIAAGAVVSGIFPKNVIIGGIPSRIIKNKDMTQASEEV